MAVFFIAFDKIYSSFLSFFAAALSFTFFWEQGGGGCSGRAAAAATSAVEAAAEAARAGAGEGPDGGVGQVPRLPARLPIPAGLRRDHQPPPPQRLVRGQVPPRPGVFFLFFLFLSMPSVGFPTLPPCIRARN